MSPVGLPWVALAFLVVGWGAWWFGHSRSTVGSVGVALFLAAMAIAVDARERALYTPLRGLLDREYGGFAIDDLGPAARHDPLPVRAILREDAALTGDSTTLRALVTAVRMGQQWVDTSGNVVLTVGGVPPDAQVSEWRAGRTIETAVVFRRPARYLNDGAADAERDVALSGVTLLGSIKSGLLVRVIARGNLTDEWASRIRLSVRTRVNRWIGRYDPVSAAIVAAVLIGDRSGLPDDVRLRLQAAGTYHVIAISGGNIAILVGLVLALFYLCGWRGRVASATTMCALLAYTQIVTTGPSVWRATVMAALYLLACVVGHRSPPWHTLALAGAAVAILRPLDVGDVGFVLTFGATAALLEVARRLRDRPPANRVVGWVVMSISASAAVELALLPVGARVFSRVTAAGLLLNLLAVPLMVVVQVAGLVVAGLGQVTALAGPAGWVAHAAASGLTESARLVDVAPWLSVRVPPPPLALVTVYYLSLAGRLMARAAVARVSLVVAGTALAAIVFGQPTRWWSGEPVDGTLRLTTFDVGQGDATLVRFPDGFTLLVDAGGTPFGGSFDVGARVLSPAIWATGVRHLDALLLTHGDPDHIGGARAILADFRPPFVWEGIPVTANRALESVLGRARSGGARVVRRLAGDDIRVGAARIRVLHPERPDWERPRTRNDDSVVLEILYGDVALLLPGDIGTAIEGRLAASLTPARHRILKVAHHGSRTSTSAAFIERWRPQVAIVSCGRGNSFGHPAREVVERLQESGAAVYRTDNDGQVDVETDGTTVRVRTFNERRAQNRRFLALSSLDGYRSQ